MGDLLIRGMPPETYDELKRRAQEAGVSLQGYVARLPERSIALHTIGALLAQLGLPDTQAPQGCARRPRGRSGTPRAPSRHRRVR
jgi:hypothetical protein